MLRETLLALSIVGLMFAGQAVADIVPTSGPMWIASVPDTNVSLGDSIGLEVAGPPDGTFNVSIDERPFNSSPPVVVYLFQLPNTTNLSGGAASAVVAIPTGQLLYGQYLLIVTNITIGFIIDETPFDIVPNAQAYDQELSAVWFNLNVTRDIQLSDQAAYSSLLNKVEGVFWACFVESAVVLAAVVMTRPSVADHRYIVKIRRAFHDLLWAPLHQLQLESWRPDEKIPVPDTGRAFKSRLFPSCIICQSPQLESWLVLHLVQDHRVRDPKRGRDYDIDRKTVKLLFERKESAQSVPSPSMLRDAIARTNVDLSDLE